MAEEYPLMKRYITPWKDILPEGIFPPHSRESSKIILPAFICPQNR